MAKYRNETPQILAVPPEETFDGTWPFEARYIDARLPQTSLGHLGNGRPNPSAGVLHSAVQRSFSERYHASSRGRWSLQP